MVKKVIKFSVVFLIILVFNLLCSPLNLDEVWNYGFANNLYRGLIPYLDFNMVITPFYPFFMSLFFYAFGSSMIVFHIVNAIILTAGLILLEKMYDNKMWIFFFFLFFPVNISAPNYSLFLLIILIVLIYLEKNYVKEKSNFIHYLIGILLGVSFLTKQTVGIFLFFPTIIIFWKNKKIFLRRLLGFLFPIFIFIIYLLFSKSFLKFVNLCILGLLDFTGNQKIFNIFGILFIIILILFYIIINYLFNKLDNKKLVKLKKLDFLKKTKIYEIFKKHPCINFMHIIFLCQHGNQLIAEYKGNDNARNRQDY